jgi:hypothetical protein
VQLTACLHDSITPSEGPIPVKHITRNLPRSGEANSGMSAGAGGKLAAGTTLNKNAGILRRNLEGAVIPRPRFPLYR